MRSRARGALVAALVSFCSNSALASAPDVIGLGAVEPAVAGASAARVRDFSSVHYDPAALALSDRTQVTLGITGLGSQLKIQLASGSEGAPISDPIGIEIGATAPIPFTGALAHRLFIGIALHVVPDAVVRVIANQPAQPFYPLYQNRTQRLVVLPALAARLPRGFTLGVAFNFLAGLSGNVAATEGSTRAIEARVDEQLKARVAVNAGLRWQTTERLALALVYRQAFGIPYDIVTSNVVAGQPIDVDVSAQGLYTPHELVLGAAFRLLPRLLASLDLEWDHWSAYDGSFVTVTSTLPLIGPIEGQLPSVRLRDTGTVRAGIEWTAIDRARVQMFLRGGYAFMSSPIPTDQSGVTNLLGGNVHRVAAGLGTRVAIARAALRFDASGQIDALQPITLHKVLATPGQPADPSHALPDEVPDDPSKPSTLGTQTSNVGYPQIRSGGFAWAAAFTFTVER